MFEKIYYNNVALLNKILETSQLGLTHDIPQNISSYILDKVSPEILSYYLSLRQTSLKYFDFKAFIFSDNCERSVVFCKQSPNIHIFLHLYL